jgi:hypothetical protein
VHFVSFRSISLFSHLVKFFMPFQPRDPIHDPEIVRVE